MAKYSKKNIEGFSGRELNELLEEGDVITGIYTHDFMGFSSYTGMPYDTINNTKIVFGGDLARYREIESGPFDVTIVRKVNSLILGLVL